MNIEEIREYCMAKKGATEGFPFGETALVFKVAGKMFCLASLALAGELWINLKNDPEKNVELRERFTSVKPGYHMNKQHWNTVEIDGSVPDEMIQQFIDDSYRIVVEKLPKKKQEELNYK